MAIKKYYPFLLVIGLLFWLSVFILPTDFLSDFGHMGGTLGGWRADCRVYGMSSQIHQK